MVSAAVKGSIEMACLSGVVVVAAVVDLVFRTGVVVIAVDAVDAGIGFVGVFPGLVGACHGDPALAIVKSVSDITSARWPNSVCDEGMDIAFCSSASVNFLIVV